LKTENKITKKIGIKIQPDSAFRPSVTAIEEQGILESFARLPQTEREIIRQLLDEFGSQAGRRNQISRFFWSQKRQ
jgi:hypothetical protein